MKQLHKDHGLTLFCDLHGHSRSRGAFVYGCKSLGNPEDTKIFPYMLSKLNPHFTFDLSVFGAYKYKESTARVCLFRELQTVPAVYTLEASFSGSLNGLVYTPELLKSIGRDICLSLIPYCNLKVPFPLQLAHVKESSIRQFIFN